MRLRAPINKATGRTKHSVGEIVQGKPVSKQDLPKPAWVEISEEAGSFYLLHFNEEGVCFADTWHQTLEEAKRQAEFEFEIPVDQWNKIE